MGQDEEREKGLRSYINFCNIAGVVFLSIYAYIFGNNFFLNSKVSIHVSRHFPVLI